MKRSAMKTGFGGLLFWGGLCMLIPSAYGQDIGLKKLEEMMVPSPQKIARGKAIYTRQCAACHGNEGANDGPSASSLGLTRGGFTAGEWKQGGGIAQVYTLISKKSEAVKHPVYNYLAYQDRWAVSHYVRSLSPTKPLDPAEVLEQTKFDAVNGVCDDAIKKGIAAKLAPKGEDQIKLGAKLYIEQGCDSCHGKEGKGDGPGGAALKPTPRNFSDGNAKWTNGSSELGVFNTLTNGIEGTSMAAYAQLSEDERWALVHYVRKWVPTASRQQSTDEQVLGVCRSLSAPPKPEAIPIKDAMRFLAQDAAATRELRQRSFGPVFASSDSDVIAGQQVYTQFCAGCHGAQGAGQSVIGPYGAFPPYLYIQVRKLEPVSAGGTYEDFAHRSSEGAHSTLPNMTAAVTLSQKDWQDLQLYVSKFKGYSVAPPVLPIPTPTPTPETGQAPGAEQPSDAGQTPAKPQPRNPPEKELNKKDADALKEPKKTPKPPPASHAPVHP